MPAIRGLASLLDNVLDAGAKTDEIRTAFLKEIALLCGGTQAAWLPLDESQPSVSFGKPAAINLHSRTVRSFLESSETVVVYQNAILLKLSRGAGQETSGIIQVKCPRSKKRNLRPSFRSNLILFAKLFTLFEQNQRNTRLLLRSREQLRKVSEQSATLAQSHARLFEQIRSNQERLRGISRGVLKAQEEERARISRELHDQIGQSLTALKINLDILCKHLEKAISAEDLQRLDEMKRQTEDALQEVRELSRLLRPRMLDDLGLLPTLRWYVKTFSSRTGIRVLFTGRGFRSRLEPEMETALFRATQEALQNVAKHSGARSASVNLTQKNGRILLEISDAGAGFDLNQLQKTDATVAGSGLPGLRERFSLLGGSFQIHSSPGSGTKLTIRLLSTKNPSRKTK